MASDRYLPVPWDFREVLDEVIEKGLSGRIHYFSREPLIERVEGKIKNVSREDTGEYLVTENGDRVRLDKIVTLFGKPGPAFDDYESYGNACMNCRDEED